MVDLGGSEKLLKSRVTGLRLNEGRAINLSLSSLGDVVAALRKNRHVPYRNSKRTQILKDSLGNDSEVLILMHVRPCEEDLAETSCSEFCQEGESHEAHSRKAEDSKKLVELEEIMRETEEECRIVGTQLTKAESLLSASKKLLSASRNPQDDQTEPVTSFSEKQSEKSIEVPFKSPKTNLRLSSLPRFMNSTAASRQRQITREQQITKRSKSCGTETQHSVQSSGSHARENLLPEDNEKETVLGGEDPPEQES